MGSRVGIVEAGKAFKAEPVQLRAGQAVKAGREELF
jgi:hypothetical protein